MAPPMLQCSRSLQQRCACERVSVRVETRLCASPVRTPRWRRRHCSCCASIRRLACSPSPLLCGCAPSVGVSAASTRVFGSQLPTLAGGLCWLTRIARPARDSQPDHYSHAFFSPAFWSLAHSCFGPPSRLGKASPPHTSHAHAILLAIGKWGTCLLFRSRQSLQCRAYDLQPSFFGGAVATHTLAASMTQCPTSRQGCVRRTRCARFCAPSSHARNRSLFTPSCFPCRNACPTHKTPSATHAWPCFCHT